MQAFYTCCLKFCLALNNYRLSIDTVVWCLFCNLNIMRMAFFQSCRRNLHETSVFFQFFNCSCTAVTHTCTETAKELECKPRKFVEFLIERKYIYRDKRGKLLPYENKNDGLFVVRECFNEKTQWSGTQTMITPKGRETFRLLLV